MFVPLLAFGQEPSEVTKLQAGMPSPIAVLISRIVDCNHWQGEEPYDSERAAQIQKAIVELSCTSLGTDEKAALRSFGRMPGVRNAITAAKKVYL